MTSKEPGKRSEFGLAARLTIVFSTWLPSLALVGLTPVLPEIQADFATTPGAAYLVRMLITVVGAGIIVGCAVGGFLAERLGYARVMLTSIALFSIAGASGFFLDSIWLLLLSRAVVGASVGALGVIAVAILTTEVAGLDREKWLGYYTLTGTVGACLLLVIIGLIGGHNWRWILLFHLLGIPIFVLILAYVKDRAPPARSQIAEVGDQGLPFGLICLGMACGIIVSAAQIYLPFHLARLGWGDARWIAGSLLCSTLVGGVLSFLFGTIRAKLSASGVFVAAFALMGTAMIVVISSSEFALVLVGMALYGAAIGLIPPNLFGFAAVKSTAERRARTLGLVRSGFFGGPLIAQLILEPVTTAHGPAVSLAVLAVFTGLMILIVLANDQIRHRPSARLSGSSDG